MLAALNLILGNEGAGKGTLIAWVIAQLTRGALPGNLSGDPATVGVIGDEDSWNDVWTPRLHAAGADLGRVKLIERGDGGLIEFAADRKHLHRTVAAEEMRLLFLDALIDNLGAGTDDWRPKQVRDALAPARQIARELNVAVLGSMHPNKSGTTFRQLVSGSTAFNAISRSSLGRRAVVELTASAGSQSVVGRLAGRRVKPSPEGAAKRALSPPHVNAAHLAIGGNRGENAVSTRVEIG